MAFTESISSLSTKKYGLSSSRRGEEQIAEIAGCDEEKRDSTYSLSGCSTQPIERFIGRPAIRFDFRANAENAYESWQAREASQAGFSVGDKKSVVA